MGNALGLINGTILTMDPQLPVCEAVLVVGDTIAARGTNAEIRELCAAKGGHVLDLTGNTVVPGFHDCHVHMMGTGLNALGINLYDCKSVDEVLQKVAAAAETYPEDCWIFGKRIISTTSQNLESST